MERLGELTARMQAEGTRFTAGRYLQAWAQGRNDPADALPWAESQRHWLDQRKIVGAVKAAISSLGTDEFPGALVPVADSFLAAMRGFSVPMRLTNLRRVPMLTRLFINSQGITAVEVAQGGAIPVLRGAWATTTLTPRWFGTIAVQSDELMRSTSPAATLAILDDLAQAVAEAENFQFVNPDASGSVLNSATNFIGTGSSVVQVDGDLATLIAAVPGASQPGAAFVMTKKSATFLSLLRGTGGAPCHPNIGPQGGALLGLPVLITEACNFVGSPNVRCIGLLSPSEIFYADDGRVELSTSNAAALKMDDTATAAPGSVTSLYQANATATATKGQHQAAWFARAGSAAYFVCGY